MNPQWQPAKIPFQDWAPPQGESTGKRFKTEGSDKSDVGEGGRLEEEPEKSQKGSHPTYNVPKNTDGEALWDWKKYPKPHFLLKVQDN